MVVESRSEEYVASRIRAGILEQSTVDLLRAVGLGERLEREGDEHRGIYLQWPGERHHLDFVDLTGRSVWVYGQTEVQKDLVAAAHARGQVVHYEVADTALHDLETDEPSVTFTRRRATDPAARRRRDRLRRLVRAVARRRTDAVDVGAHLPLLVARDPRRRRPVDRRADLRLAPGGLRAALDAVVVGVAVLPPGAQRHLARRLVRRPDLGRSGHAVRPRLDGWSLQTGPITDRSVLPMRSFVQTPMRHGRLFLAGDAAHIVPPTGAKGLNLAVADVALLAPALVAWLRKDDASLADAYADTALRRVWRCTHFSWWMTTMLHATGDPFDEQLQLSQLRWVTPAKPAPPAWRRTTPGCRSGSELRSGGCSGSGGRRCPGRQRP